MRNIRTRSSLSSAHVVLHSPPEKPFDKQRADYITETHTHTPPAAHTVIFNCLFSDVADYEEAINTQLVRWPIREAPPLLPRVFVCSHKCGSFGEPGRTLTRWANFT